jgi:predicted peptidase
MRIAIAGAVVSAALAAALAQAPASKPSAETLLKQYRDAAAAKADNRQLQALAEKLKETLYEPAFFWGKQDFALPYRLYKPASLEAGRKYPLLVVLHGVGQRGLDNQQQMGNPATDWAFNEVQSTYGPFFVLVPQCPQTVDQFEFAAAGGKVLLPGGGSGYSGKDWQHIRIPVGQFLRGQRKFLTLAAQKYKKQDKYDFSIRNISLDGKTLDLASAKASGYDGGKPASQPAAEDGGKTLHFIGDQPISEKSVLELDFKADVLGDRHAIGLDSDDTADDLKWITLGPQGWKTYSFTKEPSAPMSLLMDLIDQKMSDLPIDADRVYVTGLSMGGFGAGDLIARRPQQFAAAVLVCAGSDPATAPTIKHMPLWYFHGGSDPVVPTRHSQNMVKALKEAGASPKYDELPGQGHIIWGPVYAKAELPKWLFAQKRSQPAKP